MIRSWLASLKEEEMSSRSLNRKISSLKSFFRFCLKKGWIDLMPTEQLVLPRVDRRLPGFVEEKDMETLLKQVSFPDNWQGITDRLLITVFYHTGIRLQELVNLKESQWDFGRKLIKVLGKGNKERLIPVNESLCTEAKEYMALKRKTFDHPESTQLLVTSKGTRIYPKYAYRAVKTYLGEVTTAEKKSPHILRHSFATHLANRGADLNSVKELLGHSSLAATQVYTHNTIEKLKDVYKKAHPKA